jgi:hypothetical protein
MCSRNVDFVAVLIITLAMLAFSKASSLPMPEALDSIRIENAIHLEPSSLPGVLSRLDCLLK